MVVVCVRGADELFDVAEVGSAEVVCHIFVDKRVDTVFGLLWTVQVGLVAPYRGLYLNHYVNESHDNRSRNLVLNNWSLTIGPLLRYTNIKGHLLLAQAHTTHPSPVQHIFVTT